MKTWLITGCSSGLGRSLARAVMKKGYNAVVTARDVRTIIRSSVTSDGKLFELGSAS